MRRFLGEDRYLVQAESDMDVEQIKEFLDMLERGSEQRTEALTAIAALARVLTNDPVHEIDRTAIARLIEREAARLNSRG